MALPEHEKPDNSPSSNKAKLIAALADINKQLEVVDENENPIERFFKRDKLLDQQDLLEAEISASTPPSELA